MNKHGHNTNLLLLPYLLCIIPCITLCYWFLVHTGTRVCPRAEQVHFPAGTGCNPGHTLDHGHSSGDEGGMRSSRALNVTPTLQAQCTHMLLVSTAAMGLSSAAAQWSSNCPGDRAYSLMTPSTKAASVRGLPAAMPGSVTSALLKRRRTKWRSAALRLTLWARVSSQSSIIYTTRLLVRAQCVLFGCSTTGAMNQVRWIGTRTSCKT